jgi:hypothetical protein
MFGFVCVFICACIRMLPSSGTGWIHTHTHDAYASFVLLNFSRKLFDMS